MGTPSLLDDSHPDINETNTPSEASTPYLCGTCRFPVTWESKGVLCENCSVWYHICCQNIHSDDYSHLDSSSVVWYCLSCNTQNYTQVAFSCAANATNHNPYSTLDTSEDSADHSIDSLDERALPKYMSSPNPKSRPLHRPKWKPIRLINVNCQSIPSKIGAWKNLIDCTEPDIVVATETWLKPDIHNAELEMDEYAVYRRDRRNNIGGGVLIAVHKSINSTETNIETDDAELLWVKVVLKNQPDLLIAACYRPIVSDKTTIPALQRTIDSMNNKNMIISGDFNYPGFDWSKRELKAGCPYPSLHEEFQTFLEENSLTQLTTEPTRHENTLDLTLTNIPERINRSKVMPGISDHHVTYTELDMKIHRRQQAPRTLWLYKRANWEGFRLDMELKMKELADNDDLTVEEMWNGLKIAVTDGMAKFIPKKITRRKPRKPWVSAMLEQKLKKKKDLLRKSKKHGWKKVEERFQQLKKETQREFRREHNAYVEDLLRGDDTDTSAASKRFWTYVKHKRSDNAGIGTLRANSTLITNPKDKP